MYGIDLGSGKFQMVHERFDKEMYFLFVATKMKVTGHGKWVLSSRMPRMLRTS